MAPQSRQPKRTRFVRRAKLRASRASSTLLDHYFAPIARLSSSTSDLSSPRPSRASSQLPSSRRTESRTANNALDRYFAPIAQLSPSILSLSSGASPGPSIQQNITQSSQLDAIPRPDSGSLASAAHSHMDSLSATTGYNTLPLYMDLDNSTEILPPLPRVLPTSPTSDSSWPRGTDLTVNYETDTPNSIENCLSEPVPSSLVQLLPKYTYGSNSDNELLSPSEPNAAPLFSTPTLTKPITSETSLQGTMDNVSHTNTKQLSIQCDFVGHQDTQVFSPDQGQYPDQSTAELEREQEHDLGLFVSNDNLMDGFRELTPFSSSSLGISPGKQKDRDAHSEDYPDNIDVAIELLQLLSSGLNGCTEEEHLRALLLHQAQGGSNHHDLSVTYNSLPPTNQRQTEIGLASGRFPGNEGMPRRLYPNQEDLSEIFYGTTSPDKPIKNVCLHKEVSASSQPLVAFDVDSLLGFPHSLAAFKQGFRYSPVKQQAYNIKSDLHVQRTIRYTTRDGQLHQVSHSLQDIPHFFFGLVEGLHHCPVYIFLPALMDPTRKFTYITDQQMKRFVDDAMWPACQEFLEADIQQHMPPSQDVAELKARAKGIEQRVKYSENRKIQNTTFLLRREKLDSIWQGLQSRIADQTLALGDFRDAFLFVDAKGLKIDFKERYSLYYALGCFEDNMDKIFDWEYFGENDLILDIGKEICPTASPLLGSDNEEYYEPQTYLYKKCCLQRQYDNLATKLFDNSKGTATFFNIGFLNEAACLTLSPPKKSKAFRGGLYYCQWYSSVKEVFDASGYYPFQNKNILEIAIDEKVWKANAASAKVSHAKSRDSLIGSYCFSKERIHKALRDSQGSPYGLRVEFRVTWHLFQAIKYCAKPDPDITSHTIRLKSCPTYAWSVSTRKFVDFMLGNYEKITSAVEIASLTGPQSGISLERTQVIAVLLKCLREFANGSLPREQMLWFDTRRTVEGTRRGLGFETTISTFGYGWFNPIIDWDLFRFLPSIATEIVTSKDYFLSWYHNSRHLIQDSAEILDNSIDLLATYCTCIPAQEEIMKLMTHVCFRQFRKDVVDSLSKELRGGKYTSLDTDTVVFCYEGVKEAFAGSLNLVAGNKTTIKNPAMMIECLWGSNSKYNRKHFFNKPFRIMHNKTASILSQYPALHSLWESHFADEFLQYHWILPLPDANGTLISTAKCTKARNWWSIDQLSTSSSWFWARRGHRPGYPKPFPTSLTMTNEAFCNHLQTLAKQAGHNVPNFIQS